MDKYYGGSILYKNCLARYIDNVKLNINEGYDVNYVDDDTEETPLICMVSTHDTDIVKLLLTAGANINAADRCGDTALLKAIYVGANKIVELLLTSGANINQANNHGATPLIAAVAKTFIDLVKILIKKGAVINFRNNMGHIALRTAAHYNRVDILNLLLYNDADLIDDHEYDPRFITRGDNLICLYLYRKIPNNYFNIIPKDIIVLIAQCI